jgi:hypothetical protein
MKEYESLGKFSKWPFARVFGTWPNALNEAGLSPSENFHPRISDRALFLNLEQVWIALGRQPMYGHMEPPLSRYSITTYERRFGSWRCTLETFMQQVDEPIAIEPPAQLVSIPPLNDGRISGSRRSVRHTPRKPNDRLRFMVMRRDNFRCCSCGRSPSTELGVLLHIDHIIAWSKGGETTPLNLQTLCERCNLGKGTLGNEA